MDLNYKDACCKDKLDLSDADISWNDPPFTLKSNPYQDQEQRSDADISWNDPPLKCNPYQDQEQKEISVMSWNIDGLCDKGLLVRLDAVICQIIQVIPTVVMLQEVVEEHVDILQSRLGPLYEIILGDRTVEYYNAILVKKWEKDGTQDSNLKILKTNVTKYCGSAMGRHYVRVDCEVYGRKYSLFTSHLESTKQLAAERKRQLEEVMQEIRSVDREFIIIFGGDMNLRDSEKRIYPRRSAPLTDNIYDVWEKLGSDPNTEHTWDTSVNTNLQADFVAKQRFDRIFVRESPHCTPLTFSTLGTTLLQSGDMYPSDHWGILAYFLLS